MSEARGQKPEVGGRNSDQMGVNGSKFEYKLKDTERFERGVWNAEWESQLKIRSSNQKCSDVSFQWNEGEEGENIAGPRIRRSVFTMFRRDKSVFTMFPPSFGLRRDESTRQIRANQT